jgi:hypothetical protein
VRKHVTWHQLEGRPYFDGETVGKRSHWNTLRALRVLKWHTEGIASKNNEWSA